MNMLQSLLLKGYRLLSERDVIVGEASELGEFCLPLNQVITLGTAAPNLKELVGRADTFFKVERMTCNAPCSGFVFIDQVKASNMHLTFGTGAVDSYVYSPETKVAVTLNSKHVLPAGCSMYVFGKYTGFIPPGFVQGEKFNFNVTFHGKAYTFDQI